MRDVGRTREEFVNHEPQASDLRILEGLPGVLGNKGTKRKYRREQGNMTPVLGNTGT